MGSCTFQPIFLGVTASNDEYFRSTFCGPFVSLRLQFLCRGGSFDSVFKVNTHCYSKVHLFLSVQATYLSLPLRFFKLFPLVGINDEGLVKFSKYLRIQVNFSNF